MGGHWQCSASHAGREIVSSFYKKLVVGRYKIHTGGPDKKGGSRDVATLFVFMG